MPGDTYRNLVIHPTFSARTFKHILVPLWLLTYTFGAKVFHVLVNGSTGRMAGRVSEELLEGVLPGRRDYHSCIDRFARAGQQPVEETTMFDKKSKMPSADRCA